jgi:hypothetical protein
MAALYMVSLVTLGLWRRSQRSNTLEDFSDESLEIIDHGMYGGDHDPVGYTTEEVQTTTGVRSSRFSESNRERERAPRLSYDPPLKKFAVNPRFSRDFR